MPLELECNYPCLDGSGTLTGRCTKGFPSCPADSTCNMSKAGICQTNN
jgi:hypothetical protein